MELQLFDLLMDENAFNKVVSIDRRIEMRSKSPLWRLGIRPEKLALTNRMD
jgi:hypothetical protein